MLTPEDSQTMFLDDQIGDLSDYEYIESRLNDLKELKLGTFDIESFIEYINEMPNDYFEKIWNKYIEPTLLEIEDRWIYLDSEKFAFMSTSDLKKNLLKNVIIFLLDYLPYEIINRIVPEEINTVNQLREWLEENEDNLKEMITDQIDKLQESRVKILSILEATIDDITKDHIKQKYQDRIKYIKDNNYREIKYLQYFIYCIKETPLDNLKDVFVRYIDQIRGE